MIIVEGKLEDILKKYLPKFENHRNRFSDGLTPEVVIDHLYKSDTSQTKKYFEWMVNACLDLVEGNYVINNEKVGDLVTMVNNFDENLPKLEGDFLEYNKEKIESDYVYLKEKPLKDINTYNYWTLKRIIKPLIDYKTESQRKRLAKEGAKKIYSDAEYTIYEIDTYDASCFYGMGTRWCTTNKESDSNFRSYGTGKKKLLYVISNTETKESDPQFYKIAINIKYNDRDIVFYDAPDKTFDGWKYFKVKDPNVLAFLISYIKEKDPEDYQAMIPAEYTTLIKQEEEGLSDLDVIESLSKEEATNWLAYKYNLSFFEAIVKKLDLLKGNINDYLGNHFSEKEKKYLVIGKDNILKPRGLKWEDLVPDYYQLAVILDEYLPSVFINEFLGGDKNKLLKISNENVLMLYWLARGSRYAHDLAELYGAEKVIKYIIKDKKIKPIFSLTGVLPYLIKNESPKKIRELFEFAYKNDGKADQTSLTQYLWRYMGDKFIASFNKGDGVEIEPNSYGRAFMFVKQDDPDAIGTVFGVKDINKIFKSEDKAFSYFLKNYEEFIERGLNIEDMINVFNETEIDFSDRKYKYMSDWEKKNVKNDANIKSKAKKLFDFILKKYSFKKMADIVGYEGVFELFCILNFKKGINYMIENKVGDVSIDDIKIQGGKPILVVYDKKDYAFLFDDEKLAENILGEDGLDWTPYDDVVYDWYDQVWGCMEPKSIELVKAWIKSNVVEYENDEGDTIDLGDTFLNEISDDELGQIINGYNEFEELKREMEWAYDGAYNNVAQDEIINDVNEGLEEYLGAYIGYEPVKKTKRTYNKETGNYDTKEYTDYEFQYNIGDNFYAILHNYTISNFGYTIDYNTYFSTLLKETDPKKLYIETEVYPDDREVCKSFNEELLGRI